jgi:hypothetical protein
VAQKSSYEYKSPATGDTERAERSAVSGAENVGGKIAETAETAKNEAYDQIETGKEGLAGETREVASALRSAAESLRHGSPQERALNTMAAQLEEFGDTIHSKSVGAMFDDINGFARRNPAMFLGAAALIGFAAARFARATSSGASDSHDTSAAPKNRSVNTESKAQPPGAGGMPGSSVRPESATRPPATYGGGR